MPKPLKNAEMPIKHTKSYSDAQSVCLTSDSVGGQSLIDLNKTQEPVTTNINVVTFKIRTMHTSEHIVSLEKILEYTKRGGVVILNNEKLMITETSSRIGLYS